MLVKFDQMLKRNQYDRPGPTGESSNPDYDPYILLDKVNNYKKPQTPNFNLMTSRPNDGDSLPSYMKVK